MSSISTEPTRDADVTQHWRNDPYLALIALAGFIVLMMLVITIVFPGGEPQPRSTSPAATTSSAEIASQMTSRYRIDIRPVRGVVPVADSLGRTTGSWLVEGSVKTCRASSNATTMECQDEGGAFIELSRA